MAEYKTHTVAVDELDRLVTDIFTRAGCDAVEAARIAHHLISANLTGHDSHGVIRTPRYVQWLHEGKVLAGQTPEIIAESATHAVIDGKFGFGQTIGPIAVDIGIAKAKAAGLSLVALRDSGHIGRIGDWAERAAKAGLVSIHFVNVSQGEIVAPFGGVDRRFSTNPMCIGVPAQEGQEMLLLDFATSLVAEGKVLVASNGGKALPERSLVGPEGGYSTDPVTLYGPLTPGGPRDPANGTGALCTFGEHKGSGIAFMCEILAGVLTGGEVEHGLPPQRLRLSLYTLLGGAQFLRLHHAITKHLNGARHDADLVSARQGGDIGMGVPPREPTHGGRHGGYRADDRASDQPG